MTLLRSLVLICSVMVASTCTALAADGGSTYSLLGLGDLRYLPGARGTGMGYTGIALPGSQFINPTAPATWARINRVRMDASVLYEGFGSTDGRVSRYLSEMEFSGAMLAIPISQSDGIVLVTGFTPYSTVNFNLATTGTFNNGTDQLDYTLRHVGTGGLGQGLLGLSYAPWDELAVGASLNYVFGTITSTTTTTFTSSSLATGTSEQTNNIRGVLANMGVLYSGFSGVLKPLVIGASMTTQGTFNSTRQLSYTYSGGEQVTAGYDTLQPESGQIKVPIALGFGLSWALNDRMVLAADYRTQAWGSSEFYGAPPAGIRSSSMAGLGFEMAPSRDPSASFANHLAYRAGFVYNATYYQIRGIPINEWTGTIGLTLPLTNETRLNVSAEYGIRGKISNSLVKDKIFRLRMSLTLGEMWFVRPEED
jgi:hypothetical protein